jgi:hypothetical protein
VRDLVRDFVRQRRKMRAEHEGWFKAEAERVLREADDPTVRRIPHKEIRPRWHRQRAELLERIIGQRLQG